MVKIKGKIIRIGSSYGITIPKAYIDGEIITPGKQYEFVLIRKKSEIVVDDPKIAPFSSGQFSDNFRLGRKVFGNLDVRHIKNDVFALT